jgi:amidohydrolase
MSYEIDFNYLVRVRRHLHAHPELSLNEHETAAFIEAELDSLGIPHRRRGETGGLGTLQGGGGAGKTILLRADTDALPITEQTGAEYASQNVGVAHACGHDAHTAALLGAAKALASGRDSFGGTVLLVFQPAEEFGRGSQFFPGVAEQADRVFGLHVSSHLPAGHIALNYGATAAACDYFKINLTGKSAHITRPHQGADAVYMAGLLIAELHSLVPRLLDPLETALIGVGRVEAGTTYNIIADRADIEGTVRSFNDETSAFLRGKVEEAAQGIAQAHGGTAEVYFEQFAPALINDKEAVDEVFAVAVQLFGHDKVAIAEQPTMGLGADDFAVFLQDAPGVYAFVGTANEDNPHTKEPLHSPLFDIDERGLEAAARVHLAYALSVLTKGES